MKASDVQLGDVLELERIPVEVDPDAEYHQIGIRSFGNGIFHRESCKGSELSRLNYFEVKPDRLVVSNIMAWEGAVAVSTEREEGFVGSARFLSYRATGSVDIRYLNYYFQSPNGQLLIRSASTGTVTRNQTLSPRNFERSMVPLPELHEQSRIADKLDSALGRIGAIERLRMRMLNLQSTLRESLVHSALTSTTTCVRMGDVVSLTRSEIDIMPDTLYKAIGMRSFGKGVIHYSPVLGHDLSKLKYYSFPIDALTFNNIMAWEGAIGVTTEKERDFIASQRFLFYAPTCDAINVSYLRHYFLSRPGAALISACSPGAMARNRTLGIQKFENLRIRIPSRSIQDTIASTLDALQARIEEAHATPELAAFRPSLLNAAFSGRL